MKSVITLLIAIFILYRIYLRVKRSIGWQQLKPKKIMFTTTLLGIAGILFLIAGGLNWVSLLSDAAGMAIGGLLAYYSVTTTRFEQRDGGVYYRSSTWISFAVTALFFGRLIFRLYGLTFGPQAGLAGTAPMNQAAAFGSSQNPWLSGLVLIMFVYYIVYNITLMVKRNKLA
ncbi:CcdC protein domain-containing protein [Paenibacillus sp. TH7-28]